MGGVEFSTLYLARSLDRERWSPLVVCPTDGDLPERCRELAIPAVVIRRPRLFSSSTDIGLQRIVNPLAWVLNGLILISTAHRLARCLRDWAVDLVCTKGLYAHFYGGLAARWAGIPCVWHVQDLVSERAGKLYPAVLGHAGRWLAHQVIVDGEPIAVQLAPYLHGQLITVIHNGVDTECFSPQVPGGAVREEWGVADGEILVGNISRLTRWKGQAYLVHAFAALAAEFPTVKLVLVGTPAFDTDSYERELRQLVKQLGLAPRVIFAGYRWDLPEVLAALDIFVHSSVEKDTSPLAVVSAMAMGKPIVSTCVPGVAELFMPGRDAVMVAPANAASLAAGLREVLAKPERRAALGRAAREKAEQSLSLIHFARQCEAVFARALAS